MPRHKFIAWVNGCSITTDSVEQTLMRNVALTVTHPRWQSHYPGPVRVRVTTYGSQRFLREYEMQIDGSYVLLSSEGR